MHISLITLFPDFFSSPLNAGLMQRAVDRGILSFSFHNPRDETIDKYQKVDDRPYGGGPGMVLLPEPMAKTILRLGFPMQSTGDDLPKWVQDLANGAVNAVDKRQGTQKRLLYLSPKGKPLTQALAKELAQEKELTLICGRYEGLDARVESLFPVECISVGDFVLNGGEAAALCLIESVGRLLPGFMGHEESGEEESFSAGLLEYPHYTRPEKFCGLEVPLILRSGDHGKVARWRRDMSLLATLENRPDLLSEACLTEQDFTFLTGETVTCVGRNLYVALVHYPVLDKLKNSVAVSLTNLDIHDIARSSCTFGIGGYYIVTPIEDQQRLLAEVLKHWREGAGKLSNPHRDQALGMVSGVNDIADAVGDVTRRTGRRPLVVGTAARADAGLNKSIGFSAIRKKLASEPVLLLLGTGHGLAKEASQSCDAFLPPIRWHGDYNHLSVRSAAAIIFDRILGDWY